MKYFWILLLAALLSSCATTPELAAELSSTACPVLPCSYTVTSATIKSADMRLYKLNDSGQIAGQVVPPHLSSIQMAASVSRL
jgi:hypothetical protein